jgi:3-phosphoshikimate 1-carboxyvinyltransferase
LCGQSWSATLTGDASLTGRPMGRIIKPLGLMGANISASDDNPPLTVNPNHGLHAIRYEMPVASAQVKSALLLAGLYASGETAVSEPAPTRDHTERMLRGFGYSVTCDEHWISLNGGGRLSACDIKVPADLSSATFFLLAGLLSPDSEIVLPRVGMNPTRNGVLPILQRMGADIQLQNHAEMGGEPVADILVRSSNLCGTHIEGEDIALAVDEIPAIAVAAACADGVTEICGAEELRVKESDRISTTVQGLRALGITVEERPDGMKITGGKLSGGTVDSNGDHRIAMAFSIAGNVASSPVSILDTACVTTSFPGFLALARNAGMELEQI